MLSNSTDPSGPSVIAAACGSGDPAYCRTVRTPSGLAGGDKKENCNGFDRLCPAARQWRFKGVLKTLTVRADIGIIPNKGKTGEQPDYRVLSNGTELGGGWMRTGEVSGREYIRIAMAAPELGPRTLYANLGRAAGQDDEDSYALIWNPDA